LKSLADFCLAKSRAEEIKVKMNIKIVSLSNVVCEAIRVTFGKAEAKPGEVGYLDTDKLVASINCGMGQMQSDGNKAAKLSKGKFAPKTGFAGFTVSTGTDYVSTETPVVFLVWHNEQVASLKKYGSIGARQLAIPSRFDDFLSKHIVSVESLAKSAKLNLEAEKQAKSEPVAA
jgi:hypothetical protein